MGIFELAVEVVTVFSKLRNGKSKAEKPESTIDERGRGAATGAEDGIYMGKGGVMVSSRVRVVVRVAKVDSGRGLG